MLRICFTEPCQTDLKLPPQFGPQLCQKSLIWPDNKIAQQRLPSIFDNIIKVTSVEPFILICPILHDC